MFIRICFCFLFTTSAVVNAKDYHFVSINDLIEQEVGRVVLPILYAKLGLNITITPLPGKRAQHSAASGSSDGEIMRIYSYGNENTTNIRVPTPYYKLETMAFVRHGSDISIKSKDDLKHLRVAKVRGVKHSDLVTSDVKDIYDLSSTEHMMKFLSMGRADVAITNTIDGLVVLNKLGYTDIVVSDKPLATLELYHYIHEKHEPLVEQINQVIKDAKSSGELARLVEDAESVVIGNISTAN